MHSSLNCEVPRYEQSKELVLLYKTSQVKLTKENQIRF